MTEESPPNSFSGDSPALRFWQILPAGVESFVTQLVAACQILRHLCRLSILIRVMVGRGSGVQGGGLGGSGCHGQSRFVRKRPVGLTRRLVSTDVPPPRRRGVVSPFQFGGAPFTAAAVSGCAPRASRIWCSRDAAKATIRDGHTRATHRRDVCGRPFSDSLGVGGRSPSH